jgi:hypothetical protein
MKEYALLFLILTADLRAFAATYYISVNGDDAAAGTLTAPWATFKNAVSTVVKPGDTVLVRGGVYGTITPGVYAAHAVISFSRGCSFRGDAGNPLTIKAYPGETVVLDPGLSGHAYAVHFQPSISNLIQGIVIEGFVIQNAWESGIKLEDGPSHITIRGNVIKDTNGALNPTDGSDNNIGGIRSNVASYITIENNVIHGNYMREQPNNLNNSGIFIFSGTNHFTVRNNEIFNSYSGIFYKHSGNGPSLFENNLVHDMSGNGFWIATDDVTMKNNVVARANVAFNIHGEGGCTSCSSRNVIEHNTVADCGQAYMLNAYGSASLQGAVSTRIMNNIFYRSGGPEIWRYGINADFTANTPDLHAHDNNFFVSPLEFNYFGSGNSGNLGAVYSLNTFQALKSTFPASDFETRSFNSDPLFVNAVAGDYRLASGSPAAAAGTDGKDLGADLSLVGPGAGSPVPPSGGLARECDTARPEWLFCDDFESDRSASYFDPNNAGGDFSRTASVGTEGSQGMRGIFRPGQENSGSLKVSIGRNPLTTNSRRGTEDFREIYYRMYLRMQPGWQGNPAKLSRATMFTSSDWSQGMFAHLWQGTGNTLAVDPATCINASNQVACVGYNDLPDMVWLGSQSGTTPVFDTANAGQWQCVEHHVRLNDAGQSNGVSEYWINDRPEASRTGLNFVKSYAAYGINAVLFENFWNDGASPRVQERYFDNVVISTQRIGCGSAPAETPLPARPQRLRVR